MKKTVFIILIASLLLVILSLFVSAEGVEACWESSPVLLRAGGGGGGGGSSMRFLVETNLFYFVIPLILFPSSIVAYLQLTKRARKAKRLLKESMQSDSTWKYAQISSTVKESFLSIQHAWTNMDMSTASQYMSDELLRGFETKLDWMKRRNEQNILKGIRLLKALPVAVYDDPDNSHDCVWFYIKGRMIDYTVDVNTQALLNGSKMPSSFVEYWQFTKKDGRWVLNKILQKDEEHQISSAT